jgi:hypothetical protein
VCCEFIIKFFWSNGRSLFNELEFVIFFGDYDSHCLSFWTSLIRFGRNNSNSAPPGILFSVITLNPLLRMLRLGLSNNLNPTINSSLNKFYISRILASMAGRSIVL